MIRIFSHVGMDPVGGGGVAAYVSNLTEVLKNSGKGYEVICVSQFSKISMLVSFFQFFLSKKPVVLNSIFHPFSLLMIIFSRSSRLIVMPHGEFLGPALNINRRKKRVVLNLFKALCLIFGQSQKIILVAASTEETKNVSKWIVPKTILVAQDIIHLRSFLSAYQPIDQAEKQPFHVVMIGRMVRMKGFKKVLSQLYEQDLSIIQKVSLFYLTEDNTYLAEIREEIRKLRKVGADIELIAGLNADEIYVRCKNSNALLVVPSEFESFGNVLLENLWMPNKPIVSYENEFTNFLVGKGHCQIVKNDFFDAIKNAERSNIVDLNDSLEAYAREINMKTISILYGEQ